MAASMARCRFGSRRNLKLIYTAGIRQSSTYYVLLPEVPPDTPETNPIMRISEYPDFSNITPDGVITGCAKLALEYDVQFGKHMETLKDHSKAKTFSSVFDPIERVAVPMNNAWRTAKNLNYVAADDDYRTAFKRIHPQVERAKNERWIDQSLHHAVKELAADSANLSPYQQRLVNMYQTEGRLNGVDFTGPDNKKFMDVLSNIVKSKVTFRNRVMLSHNLFSHVEDDYGKLVEVPKSLLTQMAADKTNPSRGPWKITLNQNIYNPFMEYCSDRMLRWNVWHAFNNRASIKQDSQNISNHNVIKDIRQHRKDLANLLGYENFARMSMETKMAGSVENVMTMIESFKSKFLPMASEELAELQKFAISEGFTGVLELWDIPYWKRKHKEHLYSMDHGAVSEYFPLPGVLDRLFQMCHDLFAIEIKDCTNEVSTWNPDVKFFKIYDKQDDQLIAGFYLDPYARPSHKLGGSWMEPGRDRSELLGTTPISFLNMNLNPPLGGQPALMTVEDLAVLSYEFGHGLQQLLTKVPYSEIAGQRNIEWDALQVSASVMTMLMYNSATLHRLSGHWQTGEKLPDAIITNILKAHRYMNGFDTMRQLYFAALDMEMYISDDHWHAAMQRVWYEYMPIESPPDDNHPCSLTAIFSDQYPAAYYSFKWAEMIAADVYKGFEEAGLDNPEAMAAIGLRFRNTFLAEGGGMSANEVFRHFRGRDPSQEAFMKMNGVK